MERGSHFRVGEMSRIVGEGIWAYKKVERTIRADGRWNGERTGELNVVHVLGREQKWLKISYGIWCNGHIGK